MVCDFFPDFLVGVGDGEGDMDGDGEADGDGDGETDGDDVADGETDGVGEADGEGEGVVLLVPAGTAGSAVIGSLGSGSADSPTWYCAIMSWSSWTRLWQCTMYRPLWGPNFMSSRTVSPSPT